MKKLLFLTLFFSAVAFSANAQSGFGWGPRIGFNASKITRSRANSKLGLNGGLFAGYNFTRSFGIEVAALYSQQGAEREGLKLKANYMNFPVVVKIPIFLGLHAFGGPQFSARLTGKANVTGTKVKIKNMFKTWDTGVMVGLGYQFKFGLNIGTNYTFGLTNIVNKDYSYKDLIGIVKPETLNELLADFKGKNGTWQLTVGWRF